MIFKVFYQVAGGHVHCDLFAAGEIGARFTKCGSFVVRSDEFDALKRAMVAVIFDERPRL